MSLQVLHQQSQGQSHKQLFVSDAGPQSFDAAEATAVALVNSSDGSIEVDCSVEERSQQRQEPFPRYVVDCRSLLSDM